MNWRISLLLGSILKVIDPHPRTHFKDKAIAAGLALMVWVAVSPQDTVLGIVNPVPVELENTPDHLAIAADYEDEISILVRGPQRDLDNLRPGTLSPRLDLEGAVAGENVFEILPEQLDVRRGVQIERIDPSRISIMLEEKLEKSVPISAVTSGEPAPGYVVVGRRTDPEVTVVSGPASAVEALERVETRVVDVRGLSEPFSQTVTLVLDNPFVELVEGRQVELWIDILEEAEDVEFDAVPVEVVNAQYQVVVNPDTLRVLLRGPPSLLAQIDADTLRLVIDAAELSPRDDDYRIAPTIDFGQDGLADLVRLVTTYPQREINVRVFNQPARR